MMASLVRKTIFIPLLVFLGILFASRGVLAQGGAYVFDVSFLSKPPLLSVARAGSPYSELYLDNRDTATNYVARFGSWGSAVLAISLRDAMEIRPGKTEVVYSRAGTLTGIQENPIWTLRPVLAWSVPYFLTLGSGGSDQPVGVEGIDGQVGIREGKSGLDCNCPESDGQCSGATAYFDGFTAAWVYGSGYRGSVHTNCNTKKIGIGFNPWLVTALYYPAACNLTGSYGLLPGQGPHFGYQCVGPVYKSDGAMIWPEACVVNGANPAQSMDDLDRPYARLQFVPFVFQTPESYPVRINTAIGRVPSARDFSFSVGSVSVRVLDDNGNPMTDWQLINGSGPVLVPVGASQIEFTVPPLVKFSNPNSDLSRNGEKWARIAVAAARMDTGQWAILFNQTVRGDQPPPALPTFRIRGIDQLRGGLAIRGLVGWWGTDPGYNRVADRSAPDGAVPVAPRNAWQYWRNFWGDENYSDLTIGVAFAGLWPAGARPVPSPNGLINSMIDSVFGFSSVVHDHGVDITGSAFQVFVNFIPYHVEYPNNPPPPEMVGAQDQSGASSFGKQLNIQYDTLFRLGARVSFPTVQATLVYTDSRGVHRVPVMMGNAQYTATLQYEGDIWSSSGVQGGYAEIWFPGSFHAIGRTNSIAGASRSLVPSLNSSLSVTVWRRQFGDAVIQFCEATCQSVVLRVFWPERGYDGPYTKSFPVAYYEKKR